MQNFVWCTLTSFQIILSMRCSVKCNSVTKIVGASRQIIAFGSKRKKLSWKINADKRSDRRSMQNVLWEINSRLFSVERLNHSKLKTQKKKAQQSLSAAETSWANQKHSEIGTLFALLTSNLCRYVLLNVLYNCSFLLIQSRKHVNFDDEDNHTPESIVETPNNTLPFKVTALDNNAPEEVKKDNSEILLLKQLHEQMINPKRIKPKRKITELSESLTSSDKDVELDVSVLNSLDDVKDTNIENTTLDSNYSVNSSRIDKMKSKSKKMWVCLLLWRAF